MSARLWALLLILVALLTLPSGLGAQTGEGDDLVDDATVEPEPTQTPIIIIVTATPVPLERSAREVQVLQYGGGRGIGSSVRSFGYAFIVENPNPNLEANRVQYQVVVYDSDGSVVDTDSSTLAVLPPNSRTGVAGTIRLAEGVRVVSMDVQARAERYVPPVSRPIMTTQGARYLPDRSSPRVTGVLTNPLGTAVQSVRASAVLYGPGDTIIGGGFANVPFIPAGGQAATDVSVHSSTAPTRVELYGNLTLASLQ
ncbi:MAG: exported protein of unknown function [Chloroflexi bacterium]|nr:exported protein of unknown function [Chloroflexota bacterium]